MRVINDNGSATKQLLHPQTVAEISRHSVDDDDDDDWLTIAPSPQPPNTAAEPAKLLSTRTF